MSVAEMERDGKLKQMSNQPIIDAIDNLNPLHWIDEFQV